MLFVRLKVICDDCHGREEVFDAPLQNVSPHDPPLPEGWTAEEDPPDSRDEGHGPPNITFRCPPCSKKR